MSALNIGDAGDRAFILTDGAIYTVAEEVVVTGITSKVLPVRKLGIALALDQSR